MNIIIVISVLVGGYVFYKNQTESIETPKYIIENNKIPKEFDDFKILQISDLHNKIFGKNNERLLQKIYKINPDVIFITGDLVDGEKNNFDVALKFIDQIMHKYTVYHIIGNHEQKAQIKKYKKEYEVYFSRFKQKNIIDLNNESIRIHKSSSTINLYGLVTPLESYRYLFDKKEIINIDEQFITSKLGQLNTNEYNILLVHSPFQFEEYTKWGADLVLSGHVHGGIIRLPIVGGLLSPNREFFPKYDLGEYKKDNTTMIVSKGLGGSKVILRLNCKPEIVEIKLKSKK